MATKLKLLHILSLDIKIDGERNWPKVVGFCYQGGNKLLDLAWKEASSLLKDATGTVVPIHGDFRSGNMRFGQSGISKVFDFGNARNDYAEADLAVTLKDISVIQGSRDWLAAQKEFLLAYRNFAEGRLKTVAELVCASALVLSIQECSYLRREVVTDESGTLLSALNDESAYLRFLVESMPSQLSLYRHIFV